MARGGVQEAIAFLESQSARIQGDAGAQLQLGHAYCASDRVPECATAYRHAIGIDATLDTDATLRVNLVAAGGAHDAQRALPALDLALALGVPEARTLLLDAASAPGDPRLRAGARDLAESHGLTGEVDLVASYAHDLEELKTCAQRKEVVARLRALGDRRAIDPLRAAIDRKGEGSLGARSRNMNRCLRPQAEAAIRHLEGL
jgi:hypothetical protein